MSKNFYNRRSVLGDNELSTLSRAFHKKHPEYKLYKKREFGGIGKLLFTFLGEHIASSRDGIVLNGLGYFCNVVWNKRKVYKRGKNLIFNMNTDDVYQTYFFPRIFKRNALRSWMFKAQEPIRYYLKHEITKNKMKYRCHYDILRLNSQGVKYYNNDKL